MESEERSKLVRSSAQAGLLFGVLLGTIVTLQITTRTPSKSRQYLEPTRQEFKVNTLSLEDGIIWDIDADGCADLITEREGYWIRFYKPGFDKKRTGYDLRPYSLPMSSNLEEAATAMLKNSQELRYQEAKTRCDSLKE